MERPLLFLPAEKGDPPMRARALVASAFIVIALVAAQPAAAFEAEEQILGSELILTGRVLSIRPDRDELRGEPCDSAEIEVEQVWKGNPDGERIHVRTPGGALDDPGLSIEGSGRFQAGERVLVFLTRAGDVYRPWGLVFGKYTLAGTGDGARIAGSLVPPFVDEQNLASTSPSLEEIRREVRLVVARSGNDGLDVALR